MDGMDWFVCSLIYSSKMHMLGKWGLPVLDYTADQAEEACITDHMIWDLSGCLVQQQHCGLKCSNSKQVHLFSWFGLFHSGLIHWPSFYHLSKIRPSIWHCLSNRGLLSCWWKVILFWVNKPRTYIVPVLVCCLWLDMCDHIIWPVSLLTLRSTQAP